MRLATRPAPDISTSDEDCFARFDAVFDSLATQLAWDGETEPGAAHGAPAPTAVTTTTAAAPGVEEVHGEAAEFSQFEEAFDLLDSRLASASLVVGRVTPKTAPASVPALSLVDAPAAVVDVPVRIAIATTNASPIRAPRPDSGSSPASFKSVAPKASAQQLMKVTAGGVYPRSLPEGVSSLGALLGLLENVSLIQRRFGLNDGRDWIADCHNHDLVAGAFADVRQLCTDLDLQTARVRVEFAIAALDAGNLDRLGTEIDELVRHLRHDLQSCSVHPLPARRVASFDLTFGDEVRAAFPSVAGDIAEGGRCLALGRYTACAFHAIRVAERGLVALGAAADARRKLPRDGQQWDALIVSLESRLADIDKWSAGAARSQAYAFFDEALGDVRALRDVARRLSSGARAFDEHDALSAINRTRDFLVRLSERISEAQGRTLGKREFSR